MFRLQTLGLTAWPGNQRDRKQLLRAGTAAKDNNCWGRQKEKVLLRITKNQFSTIFFCFFPSHITWLSQGLRTPPAQLRLMEAWTTMKPGTAPSGPRRACWRLLWPHITSRSILCNSLPANLIPVDTPVKIQQGLVFLSGLCLWHSQPHRESGMCRSAAGCSVWGMYQYSWKGAERAGLWKRSWVSGWPQPGAWGIWAWSLICRGWQPSNVV